MTEIIKLILGAGFLVSCVGWTWGAKRLLDVDFCFVPAFVVSWVTVIIYFGGIFGVLYPVSCIVYLGGLLAFLWSFISVRKNKGWTPNRKPHLMDCCFLIGTVLFLALLPWEHLQHYDNFSHWAVVVKVMLSKNAFPTASDHLIGFTNYPLGTSSLLYYAGCFLGHREGVFLTMQGVLIFALFYAVFGLIEKPRCFILAAFLGAGLSTLSFFNLTIRINNLLVDFILPVLTLACWVIIIRFRTEPKKQVFLLLPLQALLVIVKTTGTLYLAFVVVFWCVETFRMRKAWTWKQVLAAAGTLIVSLSTYGAWKYHMATVLADTENKFSLSTSALENSDAVKSPEEMRTIILAFLKAAMDLTTRPAMGFLICNLAVIALCVIMRMYFHSKWRRTVLALILSDLMVIGYYGGILGLYLFSMPSDEALVLAGFDRYASSIIVLFVGGLVISVVSEIQARLRYTEDGLIWYESPGKKKKYQKAVLISIALIFLMLTSEYNGIIYTDAEYRTSLADTMKKVTGDRWYPGGAEDETRYLMYGSDRDGQMTDYYFQYLGRYYLYAPNVDAVCVFYEPNLENLLSGYDCLVVVEPDVVEQRMLKQHFGVDGEAGFYDIVKDGDTVILKKRQG